MNRISYLSILIVILLVIQSCYNPSKPNYQYFPNMYEPVGYETYADSDAFANGVEAQLPVEGTINRGWYPYDYPDTNEGYEAAKASAISPIKISAENQKQGKELKRELNNDFVRKTQSKNMKLIQFLPIILMTRFLL